MKYPNTKRWNLEKRKEKSLSMIGEKNPSKKPEVRLKISQKLKGRKCPWVKKGIPNLKLRGANNHNWKGGISSEGDKIRHSIEFRLWREAVFARDNWTCQKCQLRGGKICSHHIQNFAQYPELRFAIDNGITFCQNCHQKFHKIYGVKNNNKGQLEKFIK